MTDTNSIPFPFEPYPQQRALMHSIFECISSSSVGCFESPTGTGKSLSIICAALHWQANVEATIIKDAEEFSRNSCDKEDTTSGGDDWLTEIKQQVRVQSNGRDEKGKHLDRLSDRRKMIAASRQHSPRNQRPQTASGIPVGGAPRRQLLQPDTTDPEEEFSLGDYNSDTEATKVSSKANDGDYMSDNDDDEDENPIDALKLPQILYCSRTHSQISQFVTEIKRTAFSDARCISLASRRNLCINDEVLRLGSDTRVSERCLEMQKSKAEKNQQQLQQSQHGCSRGGNSCDTSTNVQTTSSKKQRNKVVELSPCAFHNRRNEEAFVNHALGRIRDIEELAQLGSQLKACPYYASRHALKHAQVICMPYNVLLQEELRASMGINLTGRVVIFDEAHNLVEAVNQIYSANVTREDVLLAEGAIAEYLTRFQTVLTGKNLFYVNLLLSVVRSVRRYLDQARAKGSAGENTAPISAAAAGPPAAGVAAVASSEVFGANDFLFRCGLDNVNFFKLRRHISETNLASKIGGYADHQRAKREAEAALVAETSTVTLKRPQTTSAGSKSHDNNLNRNSDENSRPSAINGVSSSSSTSSSGSIAGAHSGSQSMMAGPNQRQSQSHVHALRSVITLIGCLTNADRDGRVVTQLQQAPVTSSSSSSSNFSSSSSSKKPPSQANNIQQSGVNPALAQNKEATAGQPQEYSVSIKFVLLNPSVHFQQIVDQARSVLLVGGTLQPFTYVKSFLFPTVSPERLRFFSCGHVVHPSHITALAVSSGPTGMKFDFTHESRMKKEVIQDLHSAVKQICRAVPNGIVVFFTSYNYMSHVVARWRATGLYDQLLTLVPVYIEPTSATEADRLLTAYSLDAQAKCAMLLCVMGGKLSEGINFSDSLARCVVVVGMPFPDSRDPVLQEKLRFADSLEPPTSSSTSNPTSSSTAGKRLYEAMCMKTVNQCIGRSIRHINDYAAIVLLDARYSQSRVIQLLPSWLASEVRPCATFHDVRDRLKTFFDSRKAAVAAATSAEVETEKAKEGGDSRSLLTQP